MTDTIEDLKAGCDPLLDQDSEIRKCNAYLMALCQDAALEIESLRQRLHEVSLSWQESQAREAKLREALEYIAVDDCECGAACDCYSWAMFSLRAKEALALPTDDTALKEAIKQAKREALLEAADKLANDWEYIHGYPEDQVRRMAEELK